MNDSEQVKKYLESLQYIVDNTDKGVSVREEAEKVLEARSRGRDVTRHMPEIKFQCVKCYEIFDTEKKFRVHAGMNTHCGGVSREKAGLTVLMIK